MNLIARWEANMFSGWKVPSLSTPTFFRPCRCLDVHIIGENVSARIPMSFIEGATHESGDAESVQLECGHDNKRNLKGRVTQNLK